MTAIWLLPVVTLIVASSSGGILAPALLQYSRYGAIITLTLSFFLVSVGLALAMMILTMYFLRLIIYGVPQGASVVSTFIPLGPMAQGGYSILLLGQGFRSILPLQNSSQVLSSSGTGDIINVICVIIAFVLWSLATMWLLYALLAVQEVLRQGLFPFKLPVWGLIFPNVSLAFFVSMVRFTRCVGCLRQLDHSTLPRAGHQFPSRLGRDLWAHNTHPLERCLHADIFDDPRRADLRVAVHRGDRHGQGPRETRGEANARGLSRRVCGEWR